MLALNDVNKDNTYLTVQRNDNDDMQDSIFDTYQNAKMSIETLITANEFVLDTLNTNLEQILKNERNTLALALLNGEILLDVLKPKFGHGLWIKFLREYSPYSNNIRRAQRHMALWRTFKPYIAKMDELGLLKKKTNAIFGMLNSSSEAFVQALEDDELNVAFTALYRLAEKGTPDTAVQMSLDHIEKTQHFDAKVASDIVETAKAIDKITNSDFRQEVQEIVQTHGITNASVVSMLPEIRSKSPDVYNTIKNSGTVIIDSLNDGAATQIPIRHASETDIKLALGEEKAFKIVENIQAAQLHRDEWYKSKGYTRIGKIEGDTETVLSQLNNTLVTGKSYRIVVFEVQEAVEDLSE